MPAPVFVSDVFSSEMVEYSREMNPILREEFPGARAFAGTLVGGNVAFWSAILGPVPLQNLERPEVVTAALSVAGSVGGAALASPLGYKRAAAVGAGIASALFWGVMLIPFTININPKTGWIEFGWGRTGPAIILPGHGFQAAGAAIATLFVDPKKAAKEAKRVRKQRERRRKARG